jgi:hypothetical protein
MRGGTLDERMNNGRKKEQRMRNSKREEKLWYGI